MSRDRLVSEPSEFEQKIVALVEKLGEDIAALAGDGEEYEQGLGIAAVTLLDQASGFDDDDADSDLFLLVVNDDEDWDAEDEEDWFNMIDEAEEFERALDEDDDDYTPQV